MFIIMTSKIWSFYLFIFCFCFIYFILSLFLCRMWLLGINIFHIKNTTINSMLWPRYLCFFKTKNGPLPWFFLFISWWKIIYYYKFYFMVKFKILFFLVTNFIFLNKNNCLRTNCNKKNLIITKFSIAEDTFF